MRRPATTDIVLKALGLLLLTAAVLKGHELLTVPLLGKDLWSWRPFLIFQVELELALGIWLLSGVAKPLAWLAATVCFGLVCCIALFGGSPGAIACGCFGSSNVNPWTTFPLIDLPVIVALALGGMFVAIALGKNQTAMRLPEDVYGYELVGPKLGMCVAIGTAMDGIATGDLLGRRYLCQRRPILAGAGMAAMFTFVTAWALHQGLNISCGCFGSGTEKITYITLILIRAIGILLASVLACVACIWSSDMSSSAARPLGSQGPDTSLVESNGGTMALDALVAHEVNIRS